jgi:hypothetical protein
MSAAAAPPEALKFDDQGDDNVTVRRVSVPISFYTHKYVGVTHCESV